MPVHKSFIFPHPPTMNLAKQLQQQIVSEEGIVNLFWSPGLYYFFHKWVKIETNTTFLLEIPMTNIMFSLLKENSKSRTNNNVNFPFSSSALFGRIIRKHEHHHLQYSLSSIGLWRKIGLRKLLMINHLLYLSNLHQIKNRIYLLHSIFFFHRK